MAHPEGWLRAVLVVVAATSALEACHPVPRAPSRNDSSDTSAVRAETLAATPPRTVTERNVPQQSSAARAFVGTWDFAPPAGRRGPHLSITVDSAQGSEIFGRITRALSGDVETSSMFQPFRGHVDQDGVARADIQTREARSRAVHIEGTIKDGAWVLSSLVWGEELTDPATQSSWRGRKG